MSKEKTENCCNGECGGIGEIVIAPISTNEKIDWTDPKEWHKIIAENKQPIRDHKPFEITIKL